MSIKAKPIINTPIIAKIEYEFINTYSCGFEKVKPSAWRDMLTPKYLLISTTDTILAANSSSAGTIAWSISFINIFENMVRLAIIIIP
jgi:hypothetical protein